MKHDSKPPLTHPSEVLPHHWVGAWLGIFAGFIAVAAIYWYRKCRSSYRRKRKVTRRAQSAAELNSAAVATANKRVSFKTRSSSTENKEPPTGQLQEADREDTEKTPLVSHKIDSLARLLFSKALGGGKSGSKEDVNRHAPRYHYSALDLDSGTGSQERLELERRIKEGAVTACQRYLASAPRYELLEQLNDIGSRFEKQWFVVKDTSIKTDRLMSIVPVPYTCNIDCNQATRSIIIDLFQSLQHPYIYPILDLDFTYPTPSSPGPSFSPIPAPHAVLIMPYHTEGSLKDLVYGSAWQDDWGHKYGRRSAGLPVGQVQRLGRQILEALLFLRERGFPPYGHLHSGNVILQNGVARLAGLENTLLGFTSRIHSIVWRRARLAPNSVDIICFGHVLFEMSAGYELNASEPSPGHLQLDLERCPQVAEVLELIFHDPEGRYPTIEELLMHDLFRNIDLREMRMMGAGTTHRLPHQVRMLLDEVRRPRRISYSEPSSPMASRDRRHSKRQFSYDDSCLSNQERQISNTSKQHRELLLHLRTPNSLRSLRTLRPTQSMAPLFYPLELR